MVATIHMWVETVAMTAGEHEHAAHDFEAKAEQMAEARRIGFFEQLENLFSHGLNITNNDRQ